MNTINKIKMVNIFFNSLIDIGIQPKRLTDYHVQVDKEHNFYPSTRKYYNTKTMKVINYQDFILTNNESFTKFINKQNN